MSVTVRRIRDEELHAFYEAMSTAFLERPDVAAMTEASRPLVDLDRTWAAFDGPRICGTFRSFGTEITVPGLGRLPAAAISAVTVLPTHRRQGVLRDMVAAEHGAIRDRGEPIGLLYASEYPIYGRFGYGSACREATWTLDTHVGAFHGDATGRMELHPVDAETRDAMITVFDAWRVRQPGEIRRRPLRWDMELGLRPTGRPKPWSGFVAFHRDDAGGIDGYVRYSIADDAWKERQPRTTLQVDDMHALTDAAYVAVWRYLTEIDWVSRVKAEHRTVRERLPWLLSNARAASVSDVGDGLWLRLFDVARALEARTYAGQGTVVIEVVDSEAADGRTRVRLDVDGPGARCRPSRRSPDLTIDIAALSAAYLGGPPLRDTVLATGVDEHRAGALDTLGTLLRTPDEPWCSTFF